ncbi:MAG: hypothetical protein HC804_14310 [Anaerolineae bacterium]|nr:hypothetical protein [Anaerolineae bacterium]
MKRNALFLAGVVLIFGLAACGLSPEQVDQAVSTVQSMSPSQLASLATTAQALPPEQIEALATSAAVAGYPRYRPSR